jgi:hypothetical protein
LWRSVTAIAWAASVIGARLLSFAERSLKP